MLVTQGKLAEAEQLFQRCEGIFETALGPEHPTIARVLGARAETLMSQVWTNNRPLLL